MRKSAIGIGLALIVACLLFSCDGLGNVNPEEFTGNVYASIEEFNEKATLENTRHIENRIIVGDVEFADVDYSENNSGYKGKGVLIGSTVLNKYGGAVEEYNADSPSYSFEFRNGTITSSATGYVNIDHIGDTCVYMLLPPNSDVVFENITFKGVFSFGHQMYTSPWSFLNSVTFKNCTFEGIIVGTSPSITMAFYGCTFKDYTNTTDQNNSNPIWMRASNGDWSSKDMLASMQNFLFINNNVTSTRPVKVERVGLFSKSENNSYTPKMVFMNNAFDISMQDDAVAKDETKHYGIAINLADKDVAFTLVDDGNTASATTAALYTSNFKDDFGASGTKVLDSKNNDKVINAGVWKRKLNSSDTFEIKSVE